MRKISICRLELFLFGLLDKLFSVLYVQQQVSGRSLGWWKLHFGERINLFFLKQKQYWNISQKEVKGFKQKQKSTKVKDRKRTLKLKDGRALKFGL